MTDFKTYDLQELLSPLQMGCPQAANGKGIVDRDHHYWQAAAELLSRTSQIPVDEIFISWTKGLKSSAGILWFHRGQNMVYLQRRAQEQIGLGEPAKWAFPGGGFMGIKDYETPAQAAMRHAKNKMGLDVHVPEFAAFHTIVKEPYGITNEGFTDLDGNITGGDIYGLVLKHAVSDDVVESCIAQIDIKHFEVQAFNAEDFNAAVKAGQTTLDPKEVDFINAIFSGNLKI